jgi:pyrimidine-nucleoside phosphorylase
VGIAVTAHAARLAPGDRRLHALRDATATGPGAGLVAASTMSARIAGGAGAIALDVKAGAGALLPGKAEAGDAARLMAALAEPWGRRVRWVVTAMDQPLGRCVGNALEVREAGEVLRGGGASDLRELAVRAAGDLAEASGALAEGEGAGAAAEALRSGAALEAAERWVEAQDGEPGVWTDPGALPIAPVREEMLAGEEGWLAALDARGVGEAARWLGAGRLHPDQSVDPVAGVELLAKVGARVEARQPLAVVHARDEWAARRGRELLAGCLRIAPEPVAEPRLILEEGRGGAGAP